MYDTYGKDVYNTGKSGIVRCCTPLEIIDNTDAESMSDDDVEKIKAGKEKLMESAQELFSKLYEQSAPNANAGTGAESAGAAQYDADDVVDADYKEV